MADYLAKRCKIVWGDALDKTLNIGYPLDDPHAYPVARDGAERVQGTSGVEDAWTTSDDWMLDAILRWIPRDDGNTDEGNPTTGWDGANGVAAWLSWARGKKVFRFYPDIVGVAGTFFTMYLVQPMTDRPEREDNWTRRLPLSMRTSDGSAIAGY